MLCICKTYTSQFLPEINPSLADQMFAENERLDTTDRFPWHGGIQKCDIINKELCIVLDYLNT